MLKPEEYSKIFAEQLPKGVFLTSSDGKQANSMAISWGSVGVMWGIPSVIVMVRETRFTKGILDAGLGFTVSLPLDNTFAKAVAICGTKSGPVSISTRVTPPGPGRSTSRAQRRRRLRGFKGSHSPQ